MGQSSLGSTQLARTAEQQGQLSSPSSFPANNYGLGGKTGNPMGTPSASPAPAVPPSFSGLPSPVPSVPTPPSSLPAVATRPPMQGMPIPPPIPMPPSPINTTYESDILGPGMPPPSGGKMPGVGTANVTSQTPPTPPFVGGLPPIVPQQRPAPPALGKNRTPYNNPEQITNQLPVNMQPNPMLPY